MNGAVSSREQRAGSPATPATHEYLNTDELGRHLRRMARRVCRRTGRPELFDDAVQEAWLACAESVPKYGDARRVPLAQYVRSRAYWAVLHYCRANSGAFTIPERMWRKRAAGADDALSPAIYTLSLHEAPTEEDEESCADRLGRLGASGTIGAVHQTHTTGDDDIWRTMEHRQLGNLIERLDPRERHIVERFGEGYECAAIARELGVSRQRVHQVLHRAFSKIRAWWDAKSAA